MYEKVKEMYALVYENAGRTHILKVFDDVVEATEELTKTNEEVDKVLNELTNYAYENSPIKKNKARLRKCLVSIDD